GSSRPPPSSARPPPPPARPPPPPRLVPAGDAARPRRNQGGKPVESTLGANLLERADRDVRHQDSEEQGVLPQPERERQHAEEGQDPVRDGQRVGADDACVGTARVLPREVTPPPSARSRPRLCPTNAGGFRFGRAFPPGTLTPP